MENLLEFISNAAKGDALKAAAVAVVLVVVTYVVSRVVVRLVRKLMSIDGVPLPSASIIENIVRIVVWAVGLSIMLSTCFGVDVNALIAALGVGGVALSLGLQDTLKNFIGGLQVTVMRIVQPGDHVVVGTAEGIVEDVSWRQTVVKDYEGAVHLIPNAVISSTEVVKVEPWNLVTTRLSFINDGRDLDAMIREMEMVAKRAVERVAPLERDPWILMTEIGEYGMWAKMRFVLKDVDHAREARDAALRALAPYTRLNPEQALLPDGDED